MKKYWAFALILSIFPIFFSSCISNEENEHQVNVAIDDLIKNYNQVDNHYVDEDGYSLTLNNYRFDNNELYIEHGGSIIIHGGEIDEIKIQYQEVEALNDIRYKFSSYSLGLNNPHQGNFALENDTLIKSNDKANDYFSLYVPYGKYLIESISFSFKNLFRPEFTSIGPVDIYAFNDWHGYVNENIDEQQVGMSRLGAFLKESTLLNDEGTIILSGGDSFQGTADSNLVRGEIVNNFYNLIGLDASNFGNHEFDWGTDTLKEIIAMANYPFLGINIYDTNSDNLVDYAQKSTLLRKNNLLIGVIGAIGDVYSSISQTITNQENFEFISGINLVNIVRSEALNLRNQGAQFIIYLVHDGAEGIPSSDDYFRSFYSTSLTDYVDLVIEGHTHTQYIYLDEGQTYHLQTASYGQNINHIQIGLGENGVDVINVENIDLNQYLIKDQEIDYLYQFYEDNFIKEIRDEVLYDDVPYCYSYRPFVEFYYSYFNEYANSYLLSQGIKEELFGAVALDNLRTAISGKNFTYGQLYEAMPFDNSFAIASISGQNLINRFQNNPSYCYYFIDDNIIPSKTYYVIADSYNYDYSYNNMHLEKLLLISELKDFDQNYYSLLRSDIGVDYLYNRDVSRVALLTNEVNWLY